MNSEKSANQCKLCKGWRSHATWSATAMRPSVSLTVNTVSTLWPCGLCLKLICQSGYWENSLEALWHKQHPKCSTYGRGWGLFFSQSITKTGIDTEWMQSEKEFFFYLSWSTRAPHLLKMQGLTNQDPRVLPGRGTQKVFVLGPPWYKGKNPLS